MLVLVDGVRLNDAQSGHHNGDIPVPLDAVERIEVLYGPGSSLFGADAFGGTINASGNPVAGVSVNSKAGLDLDAASQLNSSNNGDGLLVQDDSVMTVFNTPQFSNAQGFSTINAHDNARSGVRVLTGSTLTLVNQARVLGVNNGTVGLVADNGAGLTLVNSTLTGNSVSDLQLTFGTRADLRTLVFGTYSCDGSVLVRGTSTVVCPH